MSSKPSADLLVSTFHTVLVTIVRRNAANLSLRQLVVFLTLYRGEGVHTVGSLAANLRLPTSIVMRALDRLAEMKLASRGHPADVSSIVVQRTSTGERFLHELTAIIASAAGGGDSR